MYIMVNLFGNHSLMSRQIKIVTPTTILMGAMVFNVKASVVRRSEESTRPQGLRFQLCYLCKSVAVMVITIPVAVLTKINIPIRLLLFTTDALKVVLLSKAPVMPMEVI